jgi:RecG-like helicase
MAIDAISAIKKYYETLSPTQQQKLLTDLGIDNIKTISIIDPKVAEKYCQSHNIQCDLANNSVWVQSVIDNAKTTSQNIKNSVKNFYLDRENKKGVAEQEYYNALALYAQQKTETNKTLKTLNKYTEGDTNYSTALKNYNNANTSLFNSEIALNIARDNFNSANYSAFGAYLSTMS